MPLAGKRPNQILDTGAADKEHKYESATIAHVDRFQVADQLSTNRLIRRSDLSGPLKIWILRDSTAI
jgi:hypothetical protein